MRRLLVGFAFLWMAVSAGAKQPIVPSPLLAGPLPTDYKAKIKAWLDDTLKDPMSAQVEEVRGPRVGAHLHNRDFGGAKYGQPAWWVCYKVNAKNSYGAYTGNRLYMFAFVYGSIAGEFSSPRAGYQGAEVPDTDVENECALLDNSPTGTPGAPPELIH